MLGAHDTLPASLELIFGRVYSCIHVDLSVFCLFPLSLLLLLLLLLPLFVVNLYGARRMSQQLNALYECYLLLLLLFFSLQHLPCAHSSPNTAMGYRVKRMAMMMMMTLCFENVLSATFLHLLLRFTMSLAFWYLSGTFIYSSYCVNLLPGICSYSG